MRICKCGRPSSYPPSAQKGRSCNLCYNAYQRRYRKTNGDKVRAQRRAYNRAYRKSESGINARLKETHGITLAEYNKLLALQRGTCAICGSERSKSKNLKRLSVDHDHVTGRVRGLLCNECNLAIGYMADDPDRFVTAAFYIRRYKRKHQDGVRMAKIT